MNAIDLDYENPAVQRNAAVLEASLGDDHVLFHLHTGSYCHLNETGRNIWNILAAPQTVVGLVTALTETYAVTGAECQASIVPFLRTLEESGFISPVPA